MVAKGIIGAVLGVILIKTLLRPKIDDISTKIVVNVAVLTAGYMVGESIGK